MLLARPLCLCLWQNKQAVTSTMNSLHKRGHVTPAFLMSWRYSKLPWKYLRSVRTLRQAAPPSSYALAICNSPYCADGHLNLCSSVVPAIFTSKAWEFDHRPNSHGAQVRAGMRPQVHIDASAAKMAGLLQMQGRCKRQQDMQDSNIQARRRIE